MADLIDYLEKLDAERAKLSLYARRIRKFKWVIPGTAKNLMRGLEEQWADVTAERQRTVESIWADPVLRLKMKEREQAAIDGARQRLVNHEVMTALPGRPYSISEPVKEIGVKVVGLEREEARRQHFLDEALFYYGSGAWQNDRVEVGKLTKLMDDLTLDRDRVRLARYRVLDGLYTRIALETTDKHEPVTMISENLLRGVRGEWPKAVKDVETPLSRFLAAERPEPDNTRSVEKSRERSR
jgi:hypothetical protein